MNIIVAYCRDRGIGISGKLPWHLVADLRHFKALTIGDGASAVVMGRKTWESLPLHSQPLPKRENIVLSRTMVPSKDGNPIVLDSIHAVKNVCREKNYSMVWIIGGENIYRQFLDDPDVSNIYVTDIDKVFSCDAFFPYFKEKFKLKWRSDLHMGNGFTYRFKHYVRVKGLSPTSLQ